MCLTSENLLKSCKKAYNEFNEETIEVKPTVAVDTYAIEFNDENIQPKQQFINGEVEKFEPNVSEEKKRAVFQCNIDNCTRVFYKQIRYDAHQREHCGKKVCELDSNQTGLQW